MATFTYNQTHRGQLTGGTRASEQRVDERHRTVLQVAKLATAQGEELCILRDVSGGGFQAVVYRNLAVGDVVSLELRTGRRMAGRVAWTNGSLIGAAFDQKVPILSYLAHQAFAEMGRGARPPRVRIDEPAALRVGTGVSAVDIIDASQAGMRVRSEHVLSAGNIVQIAADGLGERSASICWCRDGEVGLRFKQPLSFRDFGQWRTHKVRGRSVN